MAAIVHHNLLESLNVRVRLAQERYQQAQQAYELQIQRVKLAQLKAALETRGQYDAVDKMTRRYGDELPLLENREDVEMVHMIFLKLHQVVECCRRACEMQEQVRDQLCASMLKQV